MRIDSNKKDKDKKKKKQQSELENMVFPIMEKSLQAALNQALDDIMGDFEKGA